jgi:beta-glucosidase
LGREARALRQDILLAPHINIVRDPLFRRNHTTLGEDPFLTGRIASAEIGGIQSQGVMAQVKHLAGYNGPDSVLIGERTLHEIYLPAFEAAIKAGAASVMCAYNKVNDAWSCENAGLLNGVLRGQWGFQGFITSDWGAVRSPQAITSGVDLEMPGREILGRSGPHFTGALKEAVAKGLVPVSVIDAAVIRILSQMQRFGILNRKPAARPAAINIAGHAKIIQQIAEQSAVLLKNAGEALPLTASDLESLAVIGPTGGQVAVGYLGERGYGFESRFVSPLAALRRLVPRARITYSVGSDLTGVPILQGAADFHGPTALEPGAARTWPGNLTVPSAGEHTFMVQTDTSNGAQGSGEIVIDGRLLMRSDEFVPGGGGGFKKWSSLLPTIDGRDNPRRTLHLTAGAHTIEVTANSTGKAPLNIRFAWMTPELRRANADAAVAAAKAARTAVVFAWNEPGLSLSLPEGQDELIERVAAANPRTIVVLNTGGPVAMPWIDQVRAVVEMWYPGQEGGWATASVLLGRANPTGKLPVTFPVKIEDAPARAAGHPERWAPPAPPGRTGLDPNAPQAAFSEGIAVGYRWYGQQGIQPLFPFGHGLSYTQFQYSSLVVKRGADGVEISFTLRNVGSRKGAEVVQVYVGPVHEPPVAMAPRSLVGFERVELEPGRGKSVTIHIAARGLSYWSTEKHDWVIAEGSRPVYAGSSSRDIRLKGEIPATIPYLP